MKNKETRCEKCNSRLVYIRITTNELVCRGCGYIKKREKENER